MNRNLSIISCLVFAVACATTPETEEAVGVAAPTWAEGIAYRVAAELAKRGIETYFNGAELDGVGLKLKRGTILTRYGAFDAKDVRVSLSVAPGPIWGSFVPSISLYAKEGRLLVKRPRGGEEDNDDNKSSADWLHRLARLSGVPAVQIRVDALQVRGIRGAVQARATAYPFASQRELLAGLTNKDVEVFARLRDEGDAITGRIAAKRIALSALARGLRAARAHETSVKKRRPPMLSGGVAYGVAEFAYERGDKRSLALKLAAQVQGACIEQRRLGEGRACNIDFGGAARIGAMREQLFVDAAVMHVGEVNLRAEGLLPLKGDDAEYDFTLHVPSQPIQSMLAAIPKTWRTGLFGFELEGRVRADLSIRGAGDDIEIDPSFSFDGVKVTKAPPGQDPRRLNAPVTWTVPFPYMHSISFAPEAGYTPMSSIPPLLVDAVRISEDASFYGHDGFDRNEIAKALVDLKGGQGARGASTITQQLAKNLYFDGDRNLTRKVEEAIVTAALEASVSKHRLLEIYLNIIEWGDGVFGITRAARHYFDKAPHELNEREIAFLAGIIPAPRKVDRELRTAGVSAWAEKRTARVTHFLCDVGKLSGDQCGWDATGDDDSVLTTNF